jgi:hypothetical protein
MVVLFDLKEFQVIMRFLLVRFLGFHWIGLRRIDDLKIFVCGIPYEIIYDDAMSRCDLAYGKMDGKAAKIYIDKALPVQIKKSTLIHEWLHAIDECNSLALTEIQVSVLATELYRNGFRVRVAK